MATTKPHAPAAAVGPAAIASRSLVAQLLEWRIVALTIVAVLLLTAIPYLIAGATAPEGRHYTGILLNVPDHVQYFSWMRDLATKSLASNRLTSEPNEPAFFNLLWWAAGRIGNVTGLDYAGLFSLLRVLAIALCLSCCYAFFQLTIAGKAQRRAAFLLLAFGGGAGVLWVVVKYLLRLADVPFPEDVYTSEANTFFMMLAFPHFTMALALLTAVFALFVAALRERRLRFAVASGVVAVILGLQHTYDLLTIYAVLGLFGALLWARDRRFPRFAFWCGLIVVGLSAPPALYMFLLVKLSPVWGEVLAQFDNAGVFTPSLPHLFLLLGIPLWLALASFRPRMLQSRSDAELFVAVWFVAHFGLAYMPTDFQIHMLLGWQVPMAVLASATLVNRLGPWLAARLPIAPAAAVAAVLLVATLTNVYVFAWRITDLGRHESPYYLTSDELAALDWLGEQATADDVVFADLAIGQFVPMWSDGRAFLAHWANTLDFFGKERAVALVMASDTPDDERRAIFDRYGVSYLVYRLDGQAEAWPERAVYLLPAFRQGTIAIYRYAP